MDENSQTSLTTKKKKKAKKELTFNENRPWQSSSGSDSDEEEEAEPEIEEYQSEEERVPFTFVDKSDHEFSPESDLEEDSIEALPTRRARTAKGTFQAL